VSNGPAAAHPHRQCSLNLLRLVLRTQSRSGKFARENRTFQDSSANHAKLEKRSAQRENALFDSTSFPFAYLAYFAVAAEFRMKKT